MNIVKIFAGGDLEISSLAAYWWILLFATVFFGIVFNIFEMYEHYRKNNSIGKTEKIIVSLAHSVSFGTIISYGVLSKYETLNIYGTTPVYLAALVTTIYFFILFLHKHSVKAHTISLFILSLTGLLFWLISTL